MKKQMVIALVLLALIPVVTILGGFLFSLINPEIAAGHPNYVRNYHILHLVKLGSLFASFAVVLILFLLSCLMVIRSKERSLWWLLLAALGPFGFAMLMTLTDKAPTDTDRYSRFVLGLNIFLRILYEGGRFFVIWLLAYEAMVLKRNLMIIYESATTGLSTTQIMDQQNASSGMWAFGEGIEVMFLVVVIYLIWPIIFNIVGRVAAMVASPKAH